MLARRPLEDFAHLFTDALEGIEPEALDLGRQHLDLDAREVLGNRLAAGGLAPLVRTDLFDLDLGRLGLLAEQHLEDGKRELAVVVREALGLLSEEAALELLILLAQQKVELAILVALGLDAFEPIEQLRLGFELAPFRHLLHGEGGTRSRCDCQLYGVVLDSAFGASACGRLPGRGTPASSVASSRGSIRTAT